MTWQPYGPWHLYVAVAGDYCKVGVSRTPAWRMVVLQAACPLRIRMIHCAQVRQTNASARIVESRIHAKLSEMGLRVHGEWFLYDDRAKACLYAELGAMHVSAEHSDTSGLDAYQNGGARRGLEQAL